MPSINKATRFEAIKVHTGADRVISLKVKDGEKVKSNIGLLDPRLFSGENKLHATIDGQTSLWSLHYDSGILPQQLRQKFTGFSKLMSFVTDYFARRNIEVKEVFDA